jgi:hypothetical protein
MDLETLHFFELLVINEISNVVKLIADRVLLFVDGETIRNERRFLQTTAKRPTNKSADLA